MLSKLFFKIIYQHFFYAFYSSKPTYKNTQFNTLFWRLFLTIISQYSRFFAVILLHRNVQYCQVVSSKIANFSVFQFFFLLKFLCFQNENCVYRFLFCLRMSLSRAKKLLPKIIIILKGNRLTGNILSSSVCVFLITLYS